MNAQRVVWATVTSYVLVAVRLICGVMTFRWIYQCLDERSFGLYATLWSTMGFLVLADFGMGVAAQRVAAAHRDAPPGPERDERQAILRAIVWLSALMAGGVTLLGYGSLWCLSYFQLIPNEFCTVIAVFIVAAGCIFSTGVFREILRGRHLNWIINAADIVSTVISTLCMWLVTASGATLMPIVLIGVGMLILTNVSLVVIANWVPMWRIGRPNIDVARIKEVASFSLYSYGVAVAGVIGRCDQVCLGYLLGLPAVAQYAVGLRVSQLGEQATQQVEVAFAPLAPLANAETDADIRLQKLRNLFFMSQRWSLVVALPVIAVLCSELTTVLNIVTGKTQHSAEIIHSAYWLLGALACSKATTSSARWILLMSNAHKQLMWITLCESLVKLSLGLLLSWYWGSVVGMACGIFWVTALSSVGIVGPYICGHLKVTIRELMLAYVRPLIYTIFLTLIMYGLWTSVGLRSAWLQLAFASCCGGIALVVSAWFFALTEFWRKRIIVGILRQR